MRKSELMKINKVVLEAIDNMNDDIQNYGLSKARRLRTCNASVLETPNYYILVSYNTTVACIDKRSDTLYDFLRFTYGYTATSAQHISKFEKDYGKGKWGCQYKSRYYEI